MKVKDIPNELHQVLSNAIGELVDDGSALDGWMVNANITGCVLDDFQPTSIEKEESGALRITSDASFCGEADPEAFKGDRIDAVVTVTVRHNQETGMWEVEGIQEHGVRINFE